MLQKKGGIMVILSSPSGAGKTTLVKLLSKKNSFFISISHTINKHTAKIKTNDNKSELKLYRKSSLTSKNNIFSKMNINNEKQT